MGAVLQLGDWKTGELLLILKKTTYYEMLHNLMDVCGHGNETSAPINGEELLLGIVE
jgi:hypothetical protein